MATKKTLNQLLKQNSFSGADAGKSLLLNWINWKTKGEKTLSNAELEKIIQSIKSSRQIEIFNAYKLLKEYLDEFIKMADGNYQQFMRGKDTILYSLKELNTAQRKYTDYLNLPLILTEKEYSKVKTDAINNYEKETTNLYTLILFTITDFINDYTENKDIPEKIKATLDGYKNETIEIEFENEILNTTGKTFDQMGYEKTLDYETQFLIKRFAEKYNTEATEKDIKTFIKNNNKAIEYLVEDVGLEAATTEKNIQIMSLIELYEDAKEREYNYLNEYTYTADKKLIENKTEFKSLFSSLKDLFIPIIEKEQISKLEALKTLSEDFLEYYNFDIRDKSTAELQKEFIDDFPELYRATKEYLSKSYKKIATLKENELITTIITNKELEKHGIKKPLADKEIKELVIRHYTKTEPKTTEQYIKQKKAKNGGIAVLYAETSNNHFDKETLKEFCNPNLLLRTNMNFEANFIEFVIDTLVKPALKAIYGINAILDVYGEIFKINLSKLKQQDIFAIQINAYNEFIYMVYDRFNGTKEQTKADKLLFKDVFKPININECKPDSKTIYALKNKLEQVHIRDTLKSEYFECFLEGANIVYEKNR